MERGNLSSPTPWLSRKERAINEKLDMGGREDRHEGKRGESLSQSKKVIAPLFLVRVVNAERISLFFSSLTLYFSIECAPTPVLALAHLLSSTNFFPYFFYSSNLIFQNFQKKKKCHPLTIIQHRRSTPSPSFGSK